MIDHMGLIVSDLTRSKTFYIRALAPLNYKPGKELPGGAGMGFVQLHEDFWIFPGEPNTPRLHVAFHAESRQAVDSFHRAALAAGGNDNGAPGLRPRYHANYYGAFVLDPDGHNIEVVCHSPA